MRQELDEIRAQMLLLYDRMEKFREDYKDDLYFRERSSLYHDAHCVWCGFYEDPCFSLRAFPSEDLR